MVRPRGMYYLGPDTFQAKKKYTWGEKTLPSKINRWTLHLIIADNQLILSSSVY